MSNELGTDLATIKEQMNEMDVKELRKTYNELYGTNIKGGNKTYLKKKIWDFVEDIERRENEAAEEIDTTENEEQENDEIEQSDETETAEEGPIQGGEPTEAEEEAEGAQEEQNSEVDATAETLTTKKKSRSRAKDPRIPPAGTVLTRSYRDKEYTVKVLEDAFEYDGKKYSSLSKVASEITRTSWNGYTFWGLNRSNR